MTITNININTMAQKKKIVITVSKKFPKTKRRNGEPTQFMAEYAATQFKDIYLDFCYKGKE